MKFSIQVLSLLTVLFFSTAAVQAQSSKVEFRIKNAGFTVPGSFSDFSADVKYDADNPRNSKFNGTVQVKSIDTNNNARDKHLRNEDFFNVDKYPTMKFLSTAVIPRSDSELKIVGELTIKDVTKKVVFDVKVKETGTKHTFTTTLKINRLDYNVGSSSWTLSNDLYMDLTIVE